MIRLRIKAPDGTSRVLALRGATIAVGRAPSADVHVDAAGASKRHGQILVSGNAVFYEDLASTNGSVLRRGERQIRLGTAHGTCRSRIETGDTILVAGYELCADVSSEVALEADVPVTVMASRADLDLGRVQDDIVATDPIVARRFLKFVRDTHGVTNESALIEAIGAFVFEAFPEATHQTAVMRDADGSVLPVLTKARDGIGELIRPSRTVIDQVMNEGVALLFNRGGGELEATESMLEQRIETAIAAPLANRSGAFGAIQLDIRASGHGAFTSKDLDLLAAVAGHVTLVLDNLRLHAEQRTALESTINALVHSLSWKDPATAEHSRRVRDVSVMVGRELGLDEEELEVLSMAAILHDLGKHGVPDEILFKPGALTEEEHAEVAKHAEYTQEILDEIFYPAHLSAVPEIAAWHHERMDGEGTYGIMGVDLPIQSRIIGACDAFDAMFTDRPYQEGRPVDDVLEILTAGSGTHWDPKVVDTLRALAPRIVDLCYDRRTDDSEAKRWPPEKDRRAAREALAAVEPEAADEGTESRPSPTGSAEPPEPESETSDDDAADAAA